MRNLDPILTYTVAIVMLYLAAVIAVVVLCTRTPCTVACTLEYQSATETICIEWDSECR